MTNAGNTRELNTSIYSQSSSLVPAPYTSMASLGENLLGVVNKLQDLVFNTIGNDSLDLPQIVWLLEALLASTYMV